MRVIEDHHLAVAYDGDAAHLHRIEPADVHAGEHAVGIAEGHEHDVLGVGLEERLTAGDKVDGVGPEPVPEHREVMRRQVPQRVDVLPDRAEACAREVQVADLSEKAVVDVALDGADRRVEKEGMPDHQHAAGLLLQRGQSLGVGHGAGQRLLDEDVHAGFKAALDDLTMR